MNCDDLYTKVDLSGLIQYVPPDIKKQEAVDHYKSVFHRTARWYKSELLHDAFAAISIHQTDNNLISVNDFTYIGREFFENLTIIYANYKINGYRSNVADLYMKFHDQVHSIHPKSII